MNEYDNGYRDGEMYYYAHPLDINLVVSINSISQYDKGFQKGYMDKYEYAHNEEDRIWKKFYGYKLR